METLVSMAVDFSLSNNAEYPHLVSISIFVAMLCVCIVVGHLLGNSRWTNESTVAIFTGSFAGVVILLVSRGKSSHILRFDQEFFFIYLLPPIIFNAGFQVKKKQFFHNFMTIMLFGVVGAFISFAIISAGSWWLFQKIGFEGLNIREYLALGAIFSATDTVCTLQVLHQEETPRLYSLVFGEGVVNDATSVVLFKAIQKINVSKIGGWAALHVLWNFLCLFSSSTALGVAIGLLTAYALKAFYFIRHSTDREVAIMMLMAYLSYTVAELLELSGILTVFFCGIVMSHYAWHNISESSRVTTRHIFSTLSFIAEAFIFLYVGMDVFDIEKWKVMKIGIKTVIGVNCILVVLVLLGRAAFVFPLSILSNNISSGAERPTVAFKHQFIIWWAGLMRGAVSIALAYKQFTVSGITWDPVHATIITSTIVVVLLTTLTLGILTKPLVRKLTHQAQDNNEQQDAHAPKEDLTLPLIGIEESTDSGFLKATKNLSILLERPVHTIHFYWRKFDNAYMRPLFGGPPISGPSISG